MSVNDAGLRRIATSWWCVAPVSDWAVALGQDMRDSSERHRSGVSGGADWNGRVAVTVSTHHSSHRRHTSRLMPHIFATTSRAVGARVGGCHVTRRCPQAAHTPLALSGGDGYLARVITGQNATLGGSVVGAVDTVEAEVRELVRRRGIDPVADRVEMRRLVADAVAEYDERSLTSSLPPLADTRQAARAVYDAVAGFGPLQRHLDDPSVEEIWINEPGRVFVARRGNSELTTTILDEGQVRDLVEKMLKSSGRRVDLSSPFVDAMLPDGSRLHVVVPDITRRHLSVNIRKFILSASSLDELVGLGTLTAQAARFLDAATVAGLNVIVAGGTQAGKTTLVKCSV